MSIELSLIFLFLIHDSSEQAMKMVVLGVITLAEIVHALGQVDEFLAATRAGAEIVGERAGIKVKIQILIVREASNLLQGARKMRVSMASHVGVVQIFLPPAPSACWASP